jgi:NADPH2:quinone reductase
MHAIVIDEWGGHEAMHEAEVEAPPVSPDFVLIRNHAAGVNPVDTKIREGKLAGLFPSGFPLILGWDAAGTVEDVGPAVTMFRPGDEVFAYCRRHHLQFGNTRRCPTRSSHASRSRCRGRRPPRSRSPA